MGTLEDQWAIQSRYKPATDCLVGPCKTAGPLSPGIVPSQAVWWAPGSLMNPLPQVYLVIVLVGPSKPKHRPVTDCLVVPLNLDGLFSPGIGLYRLSGGSPGAPLSPEQA